MLSNVMEKSLDLSNGRVDITDPCYDRGTWCALWNVKVRSGNYKCSYENESDGVWGERTKACSIVHEEYADRYLSENYLGNIGLDAGMAGFFKDKPDFDDDAWHDLCNFCSGVRDGNEENDTVGYQNDYGFWTESGYGDGSYDVYSYETDGEIVGLVIKFIEDCDDDEYDEVDYDE